MDSHAPAEDRDGIRRPPAELGGPEARTALILATVGFAICFWGWALMSPLGSSYKDTYALSAFQQSLVVAVPVVVGSLGRIPVGALTDRWGARVMFPLVSLLTIVPVLFLGLVARNYPLLLVGGFFLGLGGTSFAVGVPLVNSWYPPKRRGTAIGIFGAGMGGTAISAFTTVPLVNWLGEPAPFVLVAVLLAVYAVVARKWLRDAPGRRAPSTGSFWLAAWTTLRQPATLKLSWLYAIGFGGFVAFSVYLPTYLSNAYGLTHSDASFRMAGFVVLAVVMRPVGGALSDRFHPVPVLIACFGLAAVFAAASAFGMSLLPGGTVVFLGLAIVLGAASGATFALVAKVVPPAQVGSVTGIVGAAGGLGGFIPPLVMGAVYSATGGYHLGLGLLAVVSLATAVFTVFAFGPQLRGDRAVKSAG